MKKSNRIVEYTLAIFAVLVLIGTIIFVVISEKNTIKGEKTRVDINREDRIVKIHTGAVVFNSKVWTSESADGGYVFDKEHPNRGIYGEYDFVNILNGEEIKKVNYNKEKRSDDLSIYLDIEPFNVDADKKLKDVDITIEILARCDLIDFRKDLDVNFVLENKGSVKNEILSRNESMTYHITDTDELGSYVIDIFEFQHEVVNWAFDIKITDNSTYENK